MAITKKQFIKHINIHDDKTLQIVGANQIIENDLVIAEKALAFGLVPTETVEDRQEYQDLPDSEKAKIDELTNLWTDQVKADYQASIDNQSLP